jgi:superfamily II DNA or RNA helicase
VTDRWAHQPRTVAATRRAYREGARRILVVLPTGGGKTRLGRHYVEAYAARGQRVLWVAHREELVGQAAATLGGDVGVLQADRDPGEARVVVASVQTLVARGAERLPPADLVVLDEAHHYVAASWGAVARAYSGALTLGLTATPARADGTALGDLFDRLVVGATVRDLQAVGVLCPVDVIAPPRPTDGLAMTPAEALAAHAQGRPAVVFCASVAEARELAAALPRAAYVDGSQHPRERAAALAAFERGEVDVLTNVFVLTEGWDSPRLNAGDCTIVLARGCGAWSTWRQIVGRGLRVAAGVSKRCTVVDLRGAVHVHGLPDEDVELSLDGEPVRRRAVSASVAQCPACWWIGPGPASVCPSCGKAIPAKRERQRLTPEQLVAVRETATRDDKQGHFNRLCDEAQAKGYKLGWVAYKFKSRWGHWPQGYRDTRGVDALPRCA